MNSSNSNGSTEYSATAMATERGATHMARLNGYGLRFHADEFNTALPAFVTKAGGGVPAIEHLGSGEVAPAVRPHDRLGDLVPARLDGPQAIIVKAPVIAQGQMDTVGRDRSAVDDAAAIAAGFAPKRPIYERGSRAVGMDRHRDEWLQLPETKAAMHELLGAVLAEHREDTTILADEIRMTKDGDVLTGGGAGAKFVISERALPRFTQRLGMPAGAGTYLRDIRPEVRALNVNRWTIEDVPAAHQAALKAHDVQIVNIRKANAALPRGAKATRLPAAPEREKVQLRHRDCPVGREVFAVVSEGYGALDADVIAKGVSRVVGEGSRAMVKYDGFRTQVDVTWFSDVKPDQAVAGEFFKAGLRLLSDDTGGGSCQISSMIWQNLCLNFIIIDEASQPIDVIRHIGDPEKLAARLEKAMKTAEGKLGHFLKAWGYACDEDALQRAVDAAAAAGVIESVKPFALMPISLALPGLFNGIIERQLVPVSRRDRAEVVGDLMTMFRKDVSGATMVEGKLTRAAVVNAFTRYAHEVNSDTFAQHAIEAAAGTLLYGKRGAAPAPLPFLPME